MRRRIPSVLYDDWVSINREAAQKLGENPLNTNRELRITWLALARLEPQRHSHFKRGELRGMLGVLVDRENGDIELPYRNTVKDWIDNLIKAGFLRSDSSPQCLIVNMNIADYGVKSGNTPCPNRPRAAPRAALNAA